MQTKGVASAQVQRTERSCQFKRYKYFIGMELIIHDEIGLEPGGSIQLLNDGIVGQLWPFSQIWILDCFCK